MDNKKNNVLGSGHIQLDTYKDQAYSLIKDAILYNRFRTGAVYSQESICNELGISRTPVREALLELQNEGFILFKRGKGIEVVSVNDEAAEDILEARLLIEKANASVAAKKADESDLKAITDSLKELGEKLICLDGQMLYRLDHDIHRKIALATHNDWMYKWTSIILENYLRFENKSVYSNNIDAKLVFKEHQAIVDSIVNKDSVGSEQAMEKHLKNSYRRTVNHIWSKYHE